MKFLQLLHSLPYLLDNLYQLFLPWPIHSILLSDLLMFMQNTLCIISLLLLYFLTVFLPQFPIFLQPRIPPFLFLHILFFLNNPKITNFSCNFSYFSCSRNDNCCKFWLHLSSLYLKLWRLYNNFFYLSNFVCSWNDSMFSTFLFHFYTFCIFYCKDMLFAFCCTVVIFSDFCFMRSIICFVCF